MGETTRVGESKRGGGVIGELVRLIVVQYSVEVRQSQRGTYLSTESTPRVAEAT